MKKHGISSVIQRGGAKSNFSAENFNITKTHEGTNFKYRSERILSHLFNPASEFIPKSLFWKKADSFAVSWTMRI